MVVGGGPCGSATAIRLLQLGFEVVLLERETFPRFRIGESLLPYNRRMFEELGLEGRLAGVGFPCKRGAQFHLANGSASTSFIFRQGRFTDEPEALQVERSRFDCILLERVRELGGDIRHGWLARSVQEDADGVELEVTDARGEAVAVRGDWLVDATGRANWTGGLGGLREPYRDLRKVSVFGHFDGVGRDEGERGEDTVIFRLRQGWFWSIPLSAERTSVGCVVERQAFDAAGCSPQELFHRLVAASPPLAKRMRAAQLAGELHVEADFSYRNRSFTGLRTLRAGDAAGFIDPIFSSGVFLAMHSGMEAARAIARASKAGGDSAAAFRVYSQEVGAAMDLYLGMVRRFYSKEFMEVLLHPHPRWGIAASVNAILAGDVRPRWGIRWRLRLFYGLVWLQRWVRIAPRVEFGSV